MTIAILLMAVSCFTAACHKDAQAQERTLTFETDGGTPIDPIKAKSGEKITPPADPEKSGYVFDGWYLSADFAGEPVQIPSVMPDENITYYARYATGKKIIYDYNLGDVPHGGSVTPSVGKTGSNVAVKDGAQFAAEGYLFVGWTTTPTGVISFTGGKPEGQYGAGDEITVGNTDITLYAQWAEGFTDASGQSADRVYVYVPLIGQGLGAAILVRDGSENKFGFVRVDEQTDIVEFEFYYEDSEGGNIVGRIHDDHTYVYRDDTVGSYLMYDYVTDAALEYILTTDGYGLGTLTVLVGNQSSTLAYGKYEYQSQYGDYLFTSLDPATGEENEDVYLYFLLERRPVAGTQFVGYFREQGVESGSYLLYDNGELYNYRLDLNGYGGARWYEYDALNGETTLVSEGAYRGTDLYENEYGEWEYVPSSGSGFRFILNIVADTSGNVPVYIEYNASLHVTLEEENGNATLYLDGYGSALYTAGSETFGGYCTVSDSQALITFVPYIPDGNGGHVAGGKMYFNVKWTERTFVVNTTGFVTDGTTIVSYEGESNIIAIPDGITEISADAFNYTRTDVSAVSVTIADSVQVIGARAFQNNNTLGRVTFLAREPIVIDWSSANNPFRWPAGNFIIVVPEGCQDAYKAAWSDCPYTIKGAVEVTLLPEYEIEDGVLVRYNKQPDSEDMLDLTIPDSVTEIAPYVFRGLDYIRSVDLRNVTVIGEGAFENCENLRSVVFPYVQEVGDGAFAGCVLLANGAQYGNGRIELPAVVTVGANAFQSCESLKCVVLGPDLTAIGDMAFRECHVYADEEPLFVELAGSVPPQMGAAVTVGNIAFRIRVQDIEVAKKCFADPSWNNYCKHLFIESGSEKGVYMDGAVTLELDGRAVLMTSEVMLYEIAGIDIIFYYYDEDTARYLSVTGSIGAEEISVTFWGQSYTFVKMGEVATYTSDDGKYTLTCYPRALDPEFYADDGYTGSAAVLFNGVSAELYIRGFVQKTIRGFVDSDGKCYDFEILSISGTTFTYERVRNEYVRNIACSDGSVLHIHFAGDLIYVFGELKIPVDTQSGATLPAWEEGGAVAENPSQGVYTFARTYRDTTYTVRITVSADGTSFTYTVL